MKDTLRPGGNGHSPVAPPERLRYSSSFEEQRRAKLPLPCLPEVIERLPTPTRRLRLLKFTRRPPRHLPLRSDPLHDLLLLDLNHDAANDHLPQTGVQCFEPEDQIEFADVGVQVVQRPDEDLDQVPDGEGRFGGGADDDEVQGGEALVRDQGWCQG